MRNRLRLLAFVLPALGPGGLLAEEVSGYAGEQDRAVKALSEAQSGDLLAGRGMSLALAAELNHHPGPSHALDLAAELRLTETQRQALADIRARMTAAAKALGAEIVGRERELDRGFAAAALSAEAVRQLTGAIGALQGELRAVHLTAHLETRAALTLEQVAAYDRLRGYAADAAAPPPAAGHHRGG